MPRPPETVPSGKRSGHAPSPSEGRGREHGWGRSPPGPVDSGDSGGELRGTSAGPGSERACSSPPRPALRRWARGAQTLGAWAEVARPAAFRGSVTHCPAQNTEVPSSRPRAGARERSRTHRAADAMFTRHERHVKSGVS
jgi:hypothetical protein